jgi:predicted component of type VI protein secretion system
MRLIVTKSDESVGQFQFSEGPVYIGRLTNCQVFLPDRAVSRQHAVIFATPEGKWMVEDLDSANQTYLNDKAIHKAVINTGDKIRITDFTIEVNIEEELEVEEPTTYLEDTLTDAHRETQIIVRKPDAEYAPEIRLPSKRVKDFMQAVEAICKANGPEALLQVLLGVTLRQFSAYHTWCALRNESKGPMTSHSGKCKDGRKVDNGQFLLLPQAPFQINEEGIRSVMVAPIMDPAGCFGVLYVDNALDHEQYTISDLDYLMLLAINTAAILENF